MATSYICAQLNIPCPSLHVYTILSAFCQHWYTWSESDGVCLPVMSCMAMLNPMTQHIISPAHICFPALVLCCIFCSCALPCACECYNNQQVVVWIHQACNCKTENAQPMPCACNLTCHSIALQAAQVRKSNYVPEKGVDYDADKHSTCTVYAGTLIQQVAFFCKPTTLLPSFIAHRGCTAAHLVPLDCYA